MKEKRREEKRREEQSRAEQGLITSNSSYIR
jgi:hypothetical protein